MLMMTVSVVPTLTRLRVAVLLVLLSPPTCGAKKRAGPELEKFVAASTQDTARLFLLERELWELILSYNQSLASPQDRERISQFMLETNIDQFIQQDSLAHVSHPLQAFHCLKRTTSQWHQWVGRLSLQNKLKKAKQILRKFPEQEDFEEGGAFGLMTLQHYYNIPYEVGRTTLDFSGSDEDHPGHDVWQHPD